MKQTLLSLEISAIYEKSDAKGLLMNKKRLEHMNKTSYRIVYGIDFKK